MDKRPIVFASTALVLRIVAQALTNALEGAGINILGQLTTWFFITTLVVIVPAYFASRIKGRLAIKCAFASAIGAASALLVFSLGALRMLDQPGMGQYFAQTIPLVVVEWIAIAGIATAVTEWFVVLRSQTT